MATTDVRKSQLLGVMAIVCILGLAYWLDMFTVSWRRQARAEFNMQPFLVFDFTLPLVFVILAIFLSWLLLVHVKSNWLTLGLCLLIGIQYLVSAISLMFPNSILFQLVNNRVFVIVNRGFLEIGNGSMIVQMEALILVIGVINLIRILVPSTSKRQ